MYQCTAWHELASEFTFDFILRNKGVFLANYLAIAVVLVSFRSNALYQRTSRVFTLLVPPH
jgi:hypothetical protein